MSAVAATQDQKPAPAVDELTAQMNSVSLGGRLYQKCWRFGRTSLNVATVFSARGVEQVLSWYMQRPVIPQTWLLTAAQQKRNAEVLQMKAKLQGREAVIQACEQLARFLNEFVPRKVGEELSVLPEALERQALFWSGLGIRYINYQLNEKTGYRDAALNSNLSRVFQSFYCGMRTRIVYLGLAQSNLDVVVNFEHVLLKMFAKLGSEAKSANAGRILEKILHIVATALASQPEIEKRIKEDEAQGPAEALIVRLTVEKEKGRLPQGLPDVSKQNVRLTDRDLYAQLEATRFEFVRQIVSQLLDRFSPQDVKEGVLWCLYELEGKKSMREILTYIIVKFGIEQIIDPHRLAIAVLAAVNKDPANYEEDGFGLETQTKVMDTGIKMVRESIQSNYDWSKVRLIFEESGMKVNPGNETLILQRKKAKAALTKYIYDIIRAQVGKTESTDQSASYFKMIREKVSRVPIFGIPVLGFHAVVNGTLYSLNYLFRDTSESKTTFFAWMMKNFTGSDFCMFLAERIVALIYHPSWHVTFHQVVGVIVREFFAPDTADKTEVDVKDCFAKIIGFVISHLTEGQTIPFRGNIGEWVKRFSADAAVDLFKKMQTPQEGPPVLDTLMSAFVPLIRELLLYTRVLDTFRKESVTFEGDGKFWECYAREFLNRHVAHHFKCQPNTSLADITKKRDELVEELLALSPDALKLRLSKVPDSLESNWVLTVHDDYNAS